MNDNMCHFYLVDFFFKCIPNLKIKPKKNMNKNKILHKLIVLQFYLFVSVGFSQQTSSSPVSVSPPTPSSISKFTQVPVSLSSGTIDVSLPIYTLKEKGLSIPITLRYDGGGVRPNQRSSWVGTNWSLHAGGVVTRVVNGIHDEINESPFVVPGDGKTYSYWSNYGDLNRNDWATYYTSLNLNNLIMLPDLNPDEFYFNMNGYSGSFFKNHLGNWVVKSSTSTHYKIEVESIAPGFGYSKLYEKFYSINSVSDTQNSTEHSIGRIVFKIKITTPDGIIYSFGGDLDAIDFTNSSPLPANYTLNENYIANAWKLTKVSHPNGSVIDLNYERKPEAYFVISRSFQSSFATNSGSLPGTGSSNSSFGESLGISKLYTTYLKSIESSNEIVEFNRESSNQKDYDWAILVNNIVDLSAWMFANGESSVGGLFPDNEDIAYKSDAKWPKLSSILVKEKGNQFVNKTIKLLYNDTDSSIKKRLFLNEVRFYQRGNGDLSGMEYLPYTFSYVPGAENIPYTTRKVDHWGYFNNNDYFLNPNNGSLNEQLVAYTASRAPNFNEMKKGALSSISYPTQLTVYFNYEAHNYAKVVKKNPTSNNSYVFSLDNLTSNNTAGGLRIERIQYSSLTSGKTRGVSYTYKSGDLSSGILGGIPNYFEQGTSTGGGNYYIWSSYPSERMSQTNGSHISYSKVKQESIDMLGFNGIISNGYTEFTYSNHDNNLYKDKPPLAFNGANFPTSWKYDSFNRRNMLRGVLLMEESYNNQNNLVSKSIYNYTINDTNYTPIRAVSKIDRSLGAFGMNHNYRIAAFENSTPFKYLSEKINYTNYINGENPLTNSANYQYNLDYKLLTQTSFLNSKDQVVETSTTYPFDYNIVPIYNNMKNKNMIAFPVHQQKIVNGKTTEAIYFDFKSHYQNFVVETVKKLEINKPVTNYATPHEVNNNIILDNRLSSNTLNKYDLRSNLIEQKRESNLNVFLWGYNFTNPIAKIENIPFDEVEQALSTLGTSYSDLQIFNSSNLEQKLNDLKSSLPKGYFTTYLYDLTNPSLLKSIKDVRNRSSFYSYDKFYRLKLIQDHDYNILKYYFYVYKNKGTNP